VANNAIRNADRSLRRHQRLLAKLPLLLNADDFGDDAADRLDDEREMARILMLLARFESRTRGHSCLRLGGLELYANRHGTRFAGRNGPFSALPRHEHIRERLGGGIDSPHPAAPVSQTPEGES